MDTSQKIEICGAGSSFSFTLFRSELIPLESLYDIIKKEEFSADLEKLKPGFMKIEKFSRVIIASFALPHKQELEVLRNGIISKLEVPVLETCRLYFLPGFLLLSGKSTPGKMALQILTPFMNVSSTNIKLSQSVITAFSEEAVIVKTAQFNKIPHHEIDKITLSGELEEIFNFKGLPLREAELTSFTGIFNSPFGIRTLKFSQQGKIQIYKSKKNTINLDLVEWLVSKLSDDSIVEQI